MALILSFYWTELIYSYILIQGVITLLCVQHGCPGVYSISFGLEVKSSHQNTPGCTVVITITCLLSSWLWHSVWKLFAVHLDSCTSLFDSDVIFLSYRHVSVYIACKWRVNVGMETNVLQSLFGDSVTYFHRIGWNWCSLRCLSIFSVSSCPESFSSLLLLLDDIRFELNFKVSKALAVSYLSFIGLPAKRPCLWKGRPSCSLVFEYIFLSSNLFLWRTVQNVFKIISMKNIG